MAFLTGQRREDLRNLAIELGEDPSLDLKIPELKKLILKSANYEEEETSGILKVIILERTEREACEKLDKEREFEKEKIDKERQFELEKLKIQSKRKITPRKDLSKIVEEEPLEEDGKESIEVNEDEVSGEIEKEKMVVKKWRGSEHEECENEDDEASEEIDGKESIEVKEDEVSGEKEEEKIVDKKWRGSEHEECENEDDEASEEIDGKESIEVKEDEVSGEMKEEKMIVKKWRESEHGEGRERGTEVGIEDEEAKALYKESEMKEAKAEIREEEKVLKKKYKKFTSKSKVKKFAAAPTRRGKKQKTAPKNEVTGSDDNVSSEEEKPVKKRGRQPPNATPTKRRGRTTISKYAKDYSWKDEAPNRKGKEAKNNSATTVRCGCRRRKPTKYTENSASEVEGEQPLENDDYEPEKKANSKKKSTTDNAFDELWCFKGGTLSEDLDGDENCNFDNADGLAHEDE